MSTHNTHHGKKAVHVKWAGKTIALGTFPTAEADDKCARAKALTRAWRSTMRPKPTREWVMLELERLDVRVVSGRVTQKDPSTSESDNDDDQNHSGPPRGSSKKNLQQQQGLGVSLGISSADQGLLNQHHQHSIATSLLNVADLTQGNDRRNSMTSMDSGFFFNRAGSLGLGPNFNHNMNGSQGGDQNTAVDEKGISNDARIPSVRPYVGGGAAAAYEATREDYYRKVAEQQKSQNKDGGAAGGGNDPAVKALTGSRGSIGGLSNNAGALGSLNQIGAGVGGMNQQMNLPLNLPTNAGKHYEMLKLHHMNLLNEIQETTLMMNLYQQQHFQQLQHEQLSKSRLVDQQSLSRNQHILPGAGSLNQDGINVSNQRGGSGSLDDGSLGLGSMGQQNSRSQVGANIGNDTGSHRPRSSGNNSRGSNSINSINNNPEDVISETIIENAPNETASNVMINNTSSITENYTNNQSLSPTSDFLTSGNNAMSNSQSNDEISSTGNASTHEEKLNRIKDEIAERQRMVDELERMESKQKGPKIEV